MDGCDGTQMKLMEENIAVVDEDDNVLRPASKRECHLSENITQTGILHRAFSVFLFNSKNELLLQQRSAEKITFPSFWANSCCSHPLHTEAELEGRDHLGVKRAAVRKLQHELGIPPEEVPVTNFHFVTRIHYKALEGFWGEHEIDHILLIKADVTLKPEPNEVQSFKYVSEKELEDFVAAAKLDSSVHISPWFGSMQSSPEMLRHWWAAIREGNQASLGDDIIHRLGTVDFKKR